MIASLRGTLLLKRPDIVIIETKGVGYEVSVPLSVLSSLPNEGESTFLYIYTHVREDSLQLFGFKSEEEKRLFTTVLGVSGIGPRIALSILSGISADKFKIALEKEDISQLTRIPGLGKKTAQRLIFELKEKLPMSETSNEREYDDVLSALSNLGYKKNDAGKALDIVYNKDVRDIETLLKESLKILTKGLSG